MESDFYVELLPAGIDGTVDGIWELVAALAAIGIFAMAIIEIVKLIFQPRYLLQKFIFVQWLTENNRSAAQDIIRLSTGGHERLLYQLPIERMVGQIDAAAQIALSYPSNYRNIIYALAQNADSNDLEAITADNQQAENLQSFSDARNRIANMIQRNLDALQLRIEGYWARGSQIAAVVLSTALIWIYVAPAAQDTADYLQVFAFSIAGGMVAPVAKDILGVLRTVKERSR